MGNNKPDCGSICTAILVYGTAVEILDVKYQSGLRFSMHTNIRISDWGRKT